MKLNKKQTIIALSSVAGVFIITASVVTAIAFDFSGTGQQQISAPVAGDFGSLRLVEGKTYEIAEMLTYAIEDEYLARAEYETIIDAFGAQRPFTNIIQAEEKHIAELEPLFARYNVNLPENNAEAYTVVPASEAEAFKAGVEAEINNIAMYETFLKQELPDDVRSVFLSLKKASESHQAAFENGVSRTGGIAATGAGGRGRQGRGRQV